MTRQWEAWLAFVAATMGMGLQLWLYRRHRQERKRERAEDLARADKLREIDQAHAILRRSVAARHWLGKHIVDLERTRTLNPDFRNAASKIMEINDAAYRRVAGGDLTGLSDLRTATDSLEGMVESLRGEQEIIFDVKRQRAGLMDRG